jgi:hypothetical protein
MHPKSRESLFFFFSLSSPWLQKKGVKFSRNATCCVILLLSPEYFFFGHPRLAHLEEVLDVDERILRSKIWVKRNQPDGCHGAGS